MADDPRDDDDLSLEEILAAQQANVEQQIASLPIMAQAARRTFDALEKEGFSSTQALYLTGVLMTQPDITPP